MYGRLERVGDSRFQELFFEYNALKQQAEVAGVDLVPEVYFYDQEMAIFAWSIWRNITFLGRSLSLAKPFYTLVQM